MATEAIFNSANYKEKRWKIIVTLVFLYLFHFFFLPYFEGFHGHGEMVFPETVQQWDSILSLRIYKSKDLSWRLYNKDFKQMKWGKESKKEKGLKIHKNHLTKPKRCTVASITAILHSRMPKKRRNLLFASK